MSEHEMSNAQQDSSTGCGFYAQSGEGLDQPMHVNGRRDMSEHTLGALRAVVQEASELDQQGKLRLLSETNPNSK